MVVPWGCSSAGRAPALQAGGQGFESPQLHLKGLEPIIWAVLGLPAKARRWYLFQCTVVGRVRLNYELFAGRFSYSESVRQPYLASHEHLGYHRRRLSQHEKNRLPTSRSHS